MPEPNPIAGYIAGLALARGVRDIAKRPGLCKLEVDEAWTVYINPHEEPRALPDVGLKTLPGHSFYVEFNGWPASMFGAVDQSVIFVAGEAANLEAFIKAVENARERAERGHA